MTESTTILRRYTDLASLIDILQTSEITLLPPSTWEDKNDRLMMDTYKNCKNLKTLLALCLTSRGETFHHWKVFADKSNGVCIQFKRPQFIEAMTDAGARVAPMRYLKQTELDPVLMDLKRLPFYKRIAFQDEGEVRAVYENVRAEKHLKRVAIDLEVIEAISLSPWMPKTVAESVIKMIEHNSVGHGFEIYKSNLLDAKAWRDFAAEYTPIELT